MEYYFLKIILNYLIQILIIRHEYERQFNWGGCPRKGIDGINLLIYDLFLKGNWISKI